MAASSKVLFPSTLLRLLLLFLVLSHEGTASYDVVTSLKHNGINSKSEETAARREVSSPKIPSFRFRVFNFFPKGTPIPTSAPSIRANLETDVFATFANKFTKKVSTEN